MQTNQGIFLLCVIRISWQSILKIRNTKIQKCCFCSKLKYNFIKNSILQKIVQTFLFFKISPFEKERPKHILEVFCKNFFYLQPFEKTSSIVPRLLLVYTKKFNLLPVGPDCQIVCSVFGHFTTMNIFPTCSRKIGKTLAYNFLRRPYKFAKVEIFCQICHTDEVFGSNPVISNRGQLLKR